MHPTGYPQFTVNTKVVLLDDPNIKGEIIEAGYAGVRVLWNDGVRSTYITTRLKCIKVKD